MSNFGSLTDIPLHLNDLNPRLQDTDSLVHNLFDHISSFDNKLQVSELPLRKGDLTRFPTLPEYMATDTVIYASAAADLRTEFSNRFTDFKLNENPINLFSTPFSVPIEYANGNN
jgi:hypothetical protein